MLDFLCGMFVTMFFFEPLIINFVYFSNISLFTDIILTKRNRERLADFYEVKH